VAAMTVGVGAVRESGKFFALGLDTLRMSVKRPFQWRELLNQAWFIASVTILPTALVSIPFGAVIALQLGNLTAQLGAQSFTGSAAVLAIVREASPIVTALLISGAGGSAICADLGARKIREELDALQVLGVDPVKNLVVPRFLALMIVTGLFDIYAVLFGLFGGLLAEIVNGQALGPFWNTLFANSSTTDLWGSVLKSSIFGAMIAIVCCYKGMTASGGAEGVGRAVNQAVVTVFLGIGAFNYVFTQTLLATHPNILVIK
jgi:phospholipid/cholesterol/gamma-HCH transport system permease protein